MDDKTYSRFLKYVEKTENCWNWLGGLNTGGYGQFFYDKANKTAHRYSHEVHKGPIPSDLMVMHTCDNRRCVNPDHLILGTCQQNIQDAVNKGRMALGELNGRATMTAKEVREIRDLLKCKLFMHKEIAKFYDIEKSAVQNIAYRKTWTSVL